MMSFEFPIQCNASTLDYADAALTSWTTSKTIKLQAREYSSSFDTRFHILDYWDGSNTDVVRKPFVTITAVS